MKYLNLKDPKVHAEILAFITDEMTENSDLEGNNADLEGDEDPDDVLPDLSITPNNISFQGMEESFLSCFDDDVLPCEIIENPVIIGEEDRPDESDWEDFDITWGKNRLLQNYLVAFNSAKIMGML
ncbi:hypothetical protein AVEN_199375-1 [Araneus ventricosus]|uniref:Uncharacterized protein n=1 Tax=Araneus ventricosus TaxID=182803 RepID=A0A4Y2R5D4_ARAVE|nr:hypothetical protein AVEN_199375-1 [Araneus ventricosus]